MVISVKKEVKQKKNKKNINRNKKTKYEEIKNKVKDFILKYYYDEKKDLFFTDEIQKVIKITTNKKELISDYPIQLSDIYYAENTYSSDKKFDLIKKLIDIFDREDELLIKYK